MIKISTEMKGLAVPILFIAGSILFISMFFLGVTAVVQLFLPLLIVISYLLIIIFLFGFLPATFLKDLRPSLYVYSVMMSYALGISTWLLSFFFVIKSFGILGVLFILLVQFLAPIALISAALKGAWHIAEHLALWMSFSYAIKYYSQWLLNLNSTVQVKRDIIDVSAREIRES